MLEISNLPCPKSIIGKILWIDQFWHFIQGCLVCFKVNLMFCDGLCIVFIGISISEVRPWEYFCFCSLLFSSRWLWQNTEDEGQAIEWWFITRGGAILAGRWSAGGQSQLQNRSRSAKLQKNWTIMGKRLISYHVFQFGNLLNIGLMVTMATIR